MEPGFLSYLAPTLYGPRSVTKHPQTICSIVSKLSTRFRVHGALGAGDGGLGPVAAPGAPHGVPDHPISTAYHSVPDYRTTSLARLARLARWRCGGAVGVGRRGGARVGARGSHFGPIPHPTAWTCFTAACVSCWKLCRCSIL